MTSVPTEIELKLQLPDDAEQHIPLLLQQSVATIEHSEQHLFNQYYDTDNRLLHKARIGLRVRGHNGQYEQTVKTAGRVVGGLHQRPEYNVPLDSPTPQLNRFDASIWPDEIDANQLQAAIIPLFETHFVRQLYLLSYPDGSQVEVALDQGEVQAGNQQLPICELELELKNGDASYLFDLADNLAQQMPVQLSNISKAARGYQLADGNLTKPAILPDFIQLHRESTIENGFCQSLSRLLSHWQACEAAYLQQQKHGLLADMYQAINLVCHLLEVYKPLIGGDLLAPLHQNVQQRLSAWQWLDTLLQIKSLRSKKGPFRKWLSNDSALLSYLRGRFEGLLQQHQPQDLIQSASNQQLQLQLSRCLHLKPWLTSSAQASQRPLLQVAQPILQDHWQQVQPMLTATAPDKMLYLAHSLQLKCALQSSFLFAGLYEEDTRRYLAPWQDLYEGIEELLILQCLQIELENADLGQSDDFMQSSEEKSRNLIAAMLRSRRVAMQNEAFWS